MKISSIFIFDKFVYLFFVNVSFRFSMNCFRYSTNLKFDLVRRKSFLFAQIRFRLFSVVFSSTRDSMIEDDSSKSEFPSNNSTVEGLHTHSSAQSKLDERKSSSTITSKIFEHLGDNQWKFERTLTGIPMNGTVRGDAKFDRSAENELLYKEQGKLRLASMMNSTDNELDVTQKYFYVYDLKTDSITSYFVENLSQRGSFFHQIRFDAKELSSDDSISARGEHLCSQDHYSVFYTFYFDDRTKVLNRFQIKYLVKGPKKDYTSQTTFCRSH